MEPFVRTMNEITSLAKALGLDLRVWPFHKLSESELAVAEVNNP